MADVTMPRLSDTMAEGSVGRWLKRPGDHVDHGETIAEIETDKAVMELMAFESGTLQHILVPEGQTVPIGTAIAIIGEGAADATAATPPPPSVHQMPAEARATMAHTRASAEAHTEVEQRVPVVDAGGDTRSTGRIRSSPVARRMAGELGIDLRHIQGTGPGGRIIKDNVVSFAASAARAPVAPAGPGVVSSPPAASRAVPAVESARIRPMSRMRRAVARAMSESKPGVPHIYVASEIDMTAALQLRHTINTSDAADVKISVNDLVVKAAAKALRQFPVLNSSYATGADGQPGVMAHDEINIGVAVALKEGLIAPVVRNADQQELGSMAAQIKDLAARARAGTLKQPELEGATFQVSNLGMLDVVAFVSIITPPQVASLAVGAVRHVPVFHADGQVGGADQMLVVLSVDHRVTDGATAARYLQALKRLLQSPMRMIVG